MTTLIEGTVQMTVNAYAQPKAGGRTLFHVREGSTVKADRNDNQWLHLVEVNGVPIGGEVWVSSGPKQRYIKWERTIVQGAVLLYRVDFYSDGTMRVNGKPI